MSPLEIISALLRVTSFSGGILCLYAALFLYETEEDQIQSVIEAWWIRAIDARPLAIGRHIKLIQAVALKASIIIDALFGSRLISARAVGASAWFVTALIIFTLLEINIYLPLVFLSLMLIRWPWLSYVSLALAPTLFVAVGLLLSAISQGDFLDQLVGPLVFSLLVIVFVLLFTVIMLVTIAYRIAVRKLALLYLPVPALALTVIYASIAAGSIYFPFALSDPLFESDPMLRDWLAILLLVATLPIILLIALLLSLLGHRLVWPVVSRLAYAAQRHKLVRRKPLLWTLSLSLLTASSPFVASLLRQAAGLLGLD